MPPRLILKTDDAGSYVDDEGVAWSPFMVDTLAEQEPGVCEFCEEEIWDGFLCLEDAAFEVCSDCVDVVS